MPDFLLYHRSLTDELHSLKNRLRNIVDDHNWQADGEYKESALRSVIRRHLPESMLVGRGFIVTEHTTSSQIDILIVDRNAPTLFKDGDLMIVTPDAVKAAIEVKTSLRPMQEIQEAVLKLAEIGRMSQRAASQNPIWTGIFVYDDRTDMHERQGNLLAAFQSAFEQTGYKVNCMAYGKHTLIRYWTADEVEYGRVPQEPEGESWRSYLCDGLHRPISSVTCWSRLRESGENQAVTLGFPSSVENMRLELGCFQLEPVSQLKPGQNELKVTTQKD